MSLSPNQRAILLEHLDGPRPFIARGNRMISIRALERDGFLTFDARGRQTIMTRAGERIAAYLREFEPA